MEGLDGGEGRGQRRRRCWKGMSDDGEKIRNVMVMNAATDNETRDEGSGEEARRVRETPLCWQR